MPRLLTLALFASSVPALAGAQERVRVDSAEAMHRETAALQDALTKELRIAHQAREVALPPFYRRVQSDVEHRLGLVWRGPLPRAVVADLAPDAVVCDAGHCDARLESVRLRVGTDSLVAVVVILVERTLLDERVWAHELTHALLMQHGRIAESLRHDPRWFPRPLWAQR